MLMLIASYAAFAILSGRDIINAMSKEQVKAILDRVLTWPEQRQEDAAKVLMLMEASDQSVYRLTDEQVAEVERRLADPNPRRLTLDEFKERLARRIEL
jgi:NH3-dependent NAD+ synthetase